MTSRRNVMITIFALTIFVSGCTSSQGGEFSKEKLPTEVTRDYLEYHFGFGQDTKSAYNLLSNETKSNISYADYDVEMENLKRYSRGTFKIRSINLVNKSNKTANVSVSLKTQTSIGSYNQKGYVKLVKERESWRIVGTLNPFDPS